jgi:hypothetical protein
MRIEAFGWRVELRHRTPGQRPGMVPVGGRREQWRQLRCALGLHYWNRPYYSARAERRYRVCRRWGTAGGCFTELVWKRQCDGSYRLIYPKGWRRWVSLRAWRDLWSQPATRRSVRDGFRRIGPARQWVGRRESWG